MYFRVNKISFCFYFNYYWLVCVVSLKKSQTVVFIVWEGVTIVFDTRVLERVEMCDVINKCVLLTG